MDFQSIRDINWIKYKERRPLVSNLEIHPCTCFCELWQGRTWCREVEKSTILDSQLIKLNFSNYMMIIESDYILIWNNKRSHNNFIVIWPHSDRLNDESSFLVSIILIQLDMSFVFNYKLSIKINMAISCSKTLIILIVFIYAEYEYSVKYSLWIMGFMLCLNLVDWYYSFIDIKKKYGSSLKVK